MPDFDRNELAPSHPTFAWAYVTSVMLFPDDDRARRAAQHALAAERLAEALSELSSAGVGVSVDAALAVWLYESPKLGEALGGRGILSVLRPAMLAGSILSFMLRAAAHGYPELASKGACLRGFSRALRHREGTGIDTLDDAWQRYRPVAHLWAFAIDYFRLPVEDDYEILLLFLAHAEELRRMGEAYKHPQAHSPVLDPQTTWKVPTGVGLPAVSVINLPPSDEDLRIMSAKKTN